MSYCGPASLKMVLRFYGVEKTEKELAELSGWNKRLGVDDSGIKKAAEGLGFRVRVKNRSNYRDIQNWLDGGIPVIVNWFTGGRPDNSGSEMADGHYSVAVGLDKRSIYLQDPEIGRIRKIRRSDFVRVWFDFRGGQIRPNELVMRQLIAIYPSLRKIKKRKRFSLIAVG
ncbi:MAG: C39 family peptidase [Candidatus Paceibacterota bacterium]